MKLKDALIAWNPETDQIKVDSLRLNWSTRWDAAYEMTTGGCNAEVQDMSDLSARHCVLSEFVTIVVRDRVDIDAAHREFLKIDEYRRAIPSDVPGVDALCEW